MHHSIGPYGWADEAERQNMMVFDRDMEIDALRARIRELENQLRIVRNRPLGERVDDWIDRNALPFVAGMFCVIGLFFVRFWE